MFKRLFLLSITVLLSSCATSTKEPVVKSKTEAISKEEEKGIKVLQDHLDKEEHDLFFMVYNDTYNELKSEESKKEAENIYISTMESLVTDKDIDTIYTYLTNNYNEPYHLEWLSEEYQSKVNGIMSDKEKYNKDQEFTNLIKDIESKNFYVLRKAEKQVLTNPELQNVVYYGLAMQNIEGSGYESTTLDYLSRIDPKYDGIGEEKIKQLVSQYFTEEEWQSEFTSLAEREEAQAEYDKKPLPTIGMTAEEVRNSKWGEPIKVNRTTTATSVSEQWVYRDYRYLYFENGILTTIQD
ncbi:hypothetical protein [Rossellomorea marisflavi]|uniref:hypothetical protein n=1 Tax=Rossellomorea marisflavi TaxID=189381 RepID=UPI0009A6781F|nr:hypothetical protein [Rossellomorea marisflavi]